MDPSNRSEDAADAANPHTVAAGGQEVSRDPSVPTTSIASPGPKARASCPTDSHVTVTPGSTGGTGSRGGGGESLAPGTMIGPYRVVAELAHGGSSVIYVADQEVARRQVALKLLNVSYSHPDAAARFRLEVRMLALLKDPGIAQMYDAGVTDVASQPRSYFTMELVDGTTVRQFVRRKQAEGDWSERETVELCLGFMDSLAYAHDQGIVHRDLKPANMLVTHTGVTKVIDFGIAWLDPEARDDDMMHPTTQIWLGTRPYMSPEQFSGDPRSVDARSDIYTMGVVLYELLADRFPYDVSSKSMLETARTVCEVHPRPLGQEAIALQGDLEIILETALAKPPEERYGSMREFAADLRRYREGHPIQARRQSAWVHLRKWCQRHPAAATLSAIACGMLLITSMAALTAAIVAIDRSNQLTNANDDLQEANRQANERANVIADKERKLRQSNEQLLDYNERMRRTAVSRLLVRDIDLAQGEPDYIERKLNNPEFYPEDLRGFAWSLVHRVSQRTKLHWQADSLALGDVRIADDGSWCATSGTCGVKAWSLPDMKKLAAVTDRPDSPAVRLAIDSAGRRVMFCRTDGQIRLLHVDTGECPVVARASTDRPTALALTPDGDRYLIADQRGVVECWSRREEIQLWTAQVAASKIVGLTIEQAGKRLGTVSELGEIRILELASGDVVSQQSIDLESLLRRDQRLVRARFSEDLKHVVAANAGESVFAWNCRQQEATQSWQFYGPVPDIDTIGTTGGSDQLSLLVSGRGRVTTWREGSSDETFYDIDRVWAQSKESATVPGITTTSERADLAPLVVDAAAGGEWMAFGLLGGEVFVVDANPPLPYDRWVADRPTVNRVVYSERGDQIALSSGSGWVSLYDAGDGQLTRQLGRIADKSIDLRFIDDDSRLLAFDGERGMWIWDLFGEPSPQQIKASWPAQPRAALLLGNWLMVGFVGEDPCWHALKPGNSSPPTPGRLVSDLTSDDHFVALNRYTFNLNRDMLATLDDSGQLVMWSMRGNRIKARLSQRNLTGPLAFTHDRRFLVTGSHSGRLTVRRIPDLHPLHVMESNSSRVASLATSATEDLMVSAHFDGEVIFWDTQTWEPQLAFDTGFEPIRRAVFSPRGDQLVVAGRSDQVLVFSDDRSSQEPSISQPSEEERSGDVETRP